MTGSGDSEAAAVAAVAVVAEINRCPERTLGKARRLPVLLQLKHTFPTLGSVGTAPSLTLPPTRNALFATALQRF